MNRTLVRFILASVALHALVIALAYAGVPAPRRPGSSELTLYMQAAGAQTERTTAAWRQPIDASPPVRSPLTARRLPASAPRTDAVDTDVAPADIQPAHADPDPETVARTTDAARNFVLGELQTELSRYLIYPPVARLRGWDGTVWLALTVDADGRLEHLSVDRSSGYAILDRSALRALERVGRVHAAAAKLNGESTHLKLPVVYRLMED